jgi:adenylate kinase
VEAFVLLGPPGAGKGTAAAALGKHTNLRHVSTGELFRRAMRDRSATGEAIRPFMNAGQLVPDPLVMEVVSGRVQNVDPGTRMLFDGFPRTLPQAEAFDRLLASRASRVTHVLLMEADPEVLVRRLTGRRVCPECRTIYHTRTRPPATPGMCDVCGHALTQRGDDNHAAIQQRLDDYRRITTPLVQYYAEQGILHRVDANASEADIEAAILGVVRPTEGGP